MIHDSLLRISLSLVRFEREVERSSALPLFRRLPSSPPKVSTASIHCRPRATKAPPAIGSSRPALTELGSFEEVPRKNLVGSDGERMGQLQQLSKTRIYPTVVLVARRSLPAAPQSTPLWCRTLTPRFLPCSSSSPPSQMAAVAPNSNDILGNARFATASSASSPNRYDDIPTASSILSASIDPAALHPLAGLVDNKDLDYLLLDDDKISGVEGGKSVLPSRGWGDELCYGTGSTYLAGASSPPSVRAAG